MRILIIDKEGCSLDWTIRCQAEGHKVKWYMPKRTEYMENMYDAIGKGIVERVSDPREWYRWADLIFTTDNTRWLEPMAQWKKAGWPVIAPSPAAAAWEINRTIGQQVLKKAGIPIIEGKTFHDYDLAEAYVKREMERFVSKPCGDEEDKSLSYVSKSPADMIFMLERWKKLGSLKSEFILQKFVGGVEMAVGGWFGPGGFNQGWVENFEHKKFMNDDLGVATGEQGTVIRKVAKSKLADKVLKPVEDQLAALDYVGYVDVNCIIDDKGNPWPLEFTMRPGWPLFNIEQAVHIGDHAEWLLDLAQGRDAKNWDLDTIALGVVMSIPDYPYSHITRKETNGIPIYGMKELTDPSVHPCYMMMGEAPIERDGKIVKEQMLLSAGDYVLVTTGTGKTITQAKKGAYQTLKRLSMPNSPMYRTDIGNRLKKQLPLIQQHGYALGMEF